MSVSSPFSDVEWVYRDLPSITVDDFSRDDVERAITDADKDVVDDLSGVVDFGELTEVPRTIKRLSHYKACEITLLRVINSAAVVAGENALVKYWADQYEKLMSKITKGKIIIKDSNYDEYSADQVTKPPVGRVL